MICLKQDSAKLVTSVSTSLWKKGGQNKFSKKINKKVNFERIKGVKTKI